jgi:hypothetical protein
METKYTFLPLEDSFTIEGRELETNNIVIIQKFNPFSQEEFTTLEETKEFAKDFYGFNPEVDSEEEDSITIKRESVLTEVVEDESQPE